jgi:hypothetical protein
MYANEGVISRGKSQPQGLVSDHVTERNRLIDRSGGERQEALEQFVGKASGSAQRRDARAYVL